jgi:hypothetical protein
MPTPTCMLKKVPDGDNEFTAVPGTLSLVLTDLTGSTMIDTVHTLVFDRTNPAAPLPVKFTATVHTLSFPLESQKTYVIRPTFAQITAPFTSRADLKETCGQLIDTITIANLVPGYTVEVA